MARARNIKPGLFKNELLGVADPLLTLLFQSLWTLADKEGRLEDRPLRIKAETFPYRDNLDVNGYLTELQRLGFVVRYSVDGLALIQVVNFKKHQTPHNTEKPSALPAQVDNIQLNHNSESITVKQPLPDGENVVALPPDLLIPDLLIPDSRKARTSALACPPEIDRQIWDDWLTLRKAKRAPVTETVLNAAKAEAQKAGMALQSFLQEWVIRGSQGLKAEWIKPQGRNQAPSKLDGYLSNFKDKDRENERDITGTSSRLD